MTRPGKGAQTGPYYYFWCKIGDNDDLLRMTLDNRLFQDVQCLERHIGNHFGLERAPVIYDIRQKSEQMNGKVDVRLSRIKTMDRLRDRKDRSYHIIVSLGVAPSLMKRRKSDMSSQPDHPEVPTPSVVRCPDFMRYPDRIADVDKLFARWDDLLKADKTLGTRGFASLFCQGNLKLEVLDLAAKLEGPGLKLSFPVCVVQEKEEEKTKVPNKSKTLAMGSKSPGSTAASSKRMAHRMSMGSNK